MAKLSAREIKFDRFPVQAVIRRSVKRFTDRLLSTLAATHWHPNTRFGTGPDLSQNG
ncbi:MAG: hypothetical protein AAF623_00195 [Planctomycetota bacterium]